MAEPAPFTTHLSSIAPGAISIRGFDLASIIRHASFADGIFLLLTGRPPTAGESRVFEAILLTPLDHGFINTLTNTARFAMSGSQFLPAAVAAGVCAPRTMPSRRPDANGPAAAAMGVLARRRRPGSR